VPCQVLRQFATPIVDFLLLQLVHQIQYIEEPGFPAVSDTLPGYRYSKVSLAASGTATRVTLS
jgi:hypothetical protein